MLKILVVFGTRPEVIKMYPIIKELRKYPQAFNCRVCLTGQHKEMVEPLLDFFQIKIDYDLKIMGQNQSLEHITSTVMQKLKEIFDKDRPDILLVQGDTTTCMAASLEAYYQKIKVGHIEAGLRTGDIYQPFPEEVNRKIIDSISAFLFAPTDYAKEILLKEGFQEKLITVTGNTVIDSLLETKEKEFQMKGSLLENIPFTTKTIVLVTAHRRENFGDPLINICEAVKEIALKHEDVHFVYPVHLNPNVRETVFSILDNIENVSLLDPLDYFTFVYLMKFSFIILTDSGGLQEEAPSLHVPVLILRNTTERPEALKINATRIIGTNKNDIVQATIELLEEIKVYKSMANTINPYGDGKAAERIVKCLLKEVS